MKMRIFFYGFVLFLQLLFCVSGFSQESKNPFLVTWDDSIQHLSPGDSYDLKIKFHIPEQHHLYVEKTQVNVTGLAGLQEVGKKIPAGVKQQDPFTKKEEQVYLSDFEVVYHFKVPANADLGRKTLEGEIRYQGCSADLCYRPMKLNLLVPLEISSSKKTGSSASPLLSVGGDKKKSNLGFRDLLDLISGARVEKLLELSPALLVLLVFLAGLLTDFTPCILPIIPLTLAIVGAKKGRHVLHNLGLSFTLVLGISITYALLGVVTAALGLSFGFLFQSRYFLVFLILFFILMALGLLGVIPFQMPYRIRNFFGHVGGEGYKGAFLAGLSLGFIASPCVGPLIGPVLLLVAKGQNIAWGALLLFVYGLGMGSLFLVGGTFYSTVGSRFRGGKHTESFKKILALTMLLPAFYYVWILLKNPSASNSTIPWQHSFSQGAQLSKDQKKPMILDFYADWCLPCLEIDEKTFQNKEVQKKLLEVVAVKIDCTQDTPECNEAVTRFNVVGWPTLLFFDAGGQLQSDLSIVGGFVGPEKMLEILDELKKKSL
ncbi:MAG: sulfite exporter TauE/SafE family protein [Deltaproteobacteria bacterium]|nr:sulfite exporter TauE/SafE family protein [Deltaproteobacteria bacterium]